MRKILLATHGNFAAGILNAAELILGKIENVQVLCAYLDPAENFSEKAKTVVSSIAEGDEMIVVTDIFGGSVNNEFIKYLDHQGMYLISGLNLPLLIELVLSQENDTEKMISEIISQMSKQICYCNRLVIDETTDDF